MGWKSRKWRPFAHYDDSLMVLFTRVLWSRKYLKPQSPCSQSQSPHPPQAPLASPVSSPTALNIPSLPRPLISLDLHPPNYVCRRSELLSSLLVVYIWIRSFTYVFPFRVWDVVNTGRITQVWDGRVDQAY
jgi:hypothetical protein